MNVLLDTNVISKIVSGKPLDCRRRTEESRNHGDQQSTSVIVVHELLYGCARSTSPERALERVTIILSALNEIVDFTAQDAEIAAELRMSLAASGEMIGPYDLFIAAQALRLDATLATGNVREFSRIPRLKLADWTVP